ncbi:MAG: hypothetical protein CVV02_16220 [Firmicutes bacterium HGW-Firmicutes-7]|nr:MAG: hypothetical protein CVV02_16220 [Firmicutes bacterium HGW-Firmicutes-7]
MIKRKGIFRKTFIFTSLIITLVVVICFAFLYSFLPDYYYYSKKTNLKKNAELFVQQLTNIETVDASIDLISEFSSKNNSEVMSFDTQNHFLPELSSPFISFNRTGNLAIKIQSKDSELPEAVIIKKSDFVYNNANGMEANIENGNMKQTGVEADIIISKSIDNSFVSHLMIISTLQPIDEAKSIIISLMPVLLTIGVLIALIAAYFYAKQLTKPIITISEATEKMQKMIPGALSNIHSKDELGILSENLDSMYRSLCVTIENLQLEMAYANKLEQSKTSFMRAASHELKTPIAALNGIIEGMIDHVGIYKDKEKYLEESKKLIDRLSALVNEILNAAAIENPQLTYVYEPVEIATILDEALAYYQLFVEEKELDVIVEKFDFVYHTDEKMFLNIISNIFSNAVKYTEKGGEIYISLKSNEDITVLSIENKCDHIPEDQLERLFEPFYTMDDSRDKSKSGTGLGLYIVKRSLEDLQIKYKIENTYLGFKFSLFLT